jgi:hypothetical protein
MSMSDPFLPVDPERPEVENDRDVHEGAADEPDELPDAAVEETAVDESEGELHPHSSAFRTPHAGERLTAGELETDLDTES